jgi:hypothetical protein
LVEILVVITIIGMIMRLIGPGVLDHLSEPGVKAAKIQTQSFGGALDLFDLDAGGIVANDPWGHPYVYKQPAEQAACEIRSLGSDEPEVGAGTADYVTSATNLPRERASRLHPAGDGLCAGHDRLACRGLASLFSDGNVAAAIGGLRRRGRGAAQG